MEMSRALVHPGAVGRDARTGPWAHRGRSRAAVHAVAGWLRGALADAARAWALAAGVPPHLYG
jgi:hypothetical protein